MATPVTSINGVRGAFATASGATEREFLTLQASAKDMYAPPVQQVSASTESILHAVAGGVGSAIALALTYPLDQLRTYQQVG
jgi:ABC-type cobalt transport system substrate-binding protein